MMKRILVCIGVCLFMVSCADTSDNASIVNNTIFSPAAMTVDLDTEVIVEEDIVIETIDESLDVVPQEVENSSCTVHTDDYHQYDYELIDYIGEENFQTWLAEKKSQEYGGDCPIGYGFPDLVKEFQIPETVLWDIYNNTITYYSHDHDIDLLYYGAEEEIEAHYRDVAGAYERLEAKQCIFELKYMLLTRIDGDVNTIREVSIAELVKNSGMTDDEICELIGTVNSTKTNLKMTTDISALLNAENDIELIEDDVFVEEYSIN